MHVTLIIIFVVLICVLLLRQYRTTYSYWKTAKVPYINPIPVFGSTFWIWLGRASIGSLLNDVYKKSDEPFEGFFVFGQPWLLIRDAELIKSILVKDFNYFTDRATTHNARADELASNTLLGLQNQQWKHVRSKMSSTISPSRLKQFYPSICDVGNELIQYITTKCTEGEPTEIRTTVLKYVTNVLVLFSFGINSRSFKQRKCDFVKAGKQLHSHNFLRSIQMTCYTLSPFLVNTFSMKLINPTAARFLRNVFWNVFKKAENDKGIGGDLIQYLIKLNKQSKSSEFSFDGDKLVAQSVQYFIAGVDTTSLTISYAIYELSKNSKIQDRVRNEIRRCIPNASNISYESLNEMRYLDMVIYETLRKYPAFPFVGRTCIKDYKLPGTDVVIPVGNKVCISILGLHHNPTHFPDSHKFDPERFSETIPTGRFVPFSLGPRSCIGERFALIVVKVALIMVVSKFTIQPTEHKPLKFSNASLAIVPQEGLTVIFTKIEC